MSLLKPHTKKFVVNTLDNDWLGSSMHRDGDYEPHINAFLDRNLTRDSVFIDAGSNYGWHSIRSSFICESVYSFEPQTYIYNIQKGSIAENRIDNILAFNCGLGEVDEIKHMAAIDYNNPSLNMGDLNIGTGGQPVEIRTVDSFHFVVVDIIKIDVQGYEKYVLKGARDTISKCKPIIIVEVEEHQLRKFQYGAAELFGLLSDLGYVVYLLDFHYPADHVCVHRDNLPAFIERNQKYIVPLTEDNNLNHSISHGVREKIVYV